MPIIAHQHARDDWHVRALAEAGGKSGVCGRSTCTARIRRLDTPAGNARWPLTAARDQCGEVPGARETSLLGRWATRLESMGPEAPAQLQPRSQIRVACAIARRVPGRGRRGRSVRGTEAAVPPCCGWVRTPAMRGSGQGAPRVCDTCWDRRKKDVERARNSAPSSSTCDRGPRGPRCSSGRQVPESGLLLLRQGAVQARGSRSRLRRCEQTHHVPRARCRAAPRSPSAAQGLWPPWLATCGSPRRCDSPTPRSRRLLLVPSSSRFCGLWWKWCDVPPRIGRS